MQKEPFFQVTYGLYIVASGTAKNRSAYIANTVFQVSADPAKFSISCNKENVTMQMIEETRAFSFSVLEQDTPLSFIQGLGYTSSKQTNKFSQLNYKNGITGTPIVYDHSTAWFECRVTDKIDVGSHWLIIGEVVDNGMLSSGATPMTYSWYRATHKAASPEKAPTYVKPEKYKDPDSTKTTSERKVRYACAICNYVYDPAQGDNSQNISQDTPFEDLPADWVCPVCGAAKMMFTHTEA
jgi:flavin reductase (DIM6/NTAB) family NADH-FMN oxidoreductase RutF/rubredoxin